MIFFVVFSSLSSNTSSLSSPAVSPQTGNSPVQKNGVLSDSTTSTGKHETYMLKLRLLQWAWWKFPLLGLYTLCLNAGMNVSKACTASICRVVQVTLQEDRDHTLLQIICTCTLIYMVSYPKREISSKRK